MYNRMTLEDHDLEFCIFAPFLAVTTETKVIQFLCLSLTLYTTITTNTTLTIIPLTLALVIFILI